MAQTGNDGGIGHATAYVYLRIKKYFGMPDAHRRDASEVGPGEIVKITLGPKHGGAFVIDVEKTLKIFECVGGAQRFDRLVRQFDRVALSELKDQFRFERAFNVHVKL